MSKHMNALIGSVIIIALNGLLIVTPAFAYKDGEYICKNKPSLPDSIYKVHTVSLGTQALKLPHVEAIHYYHDKADDPNSPVVEARLIGLAVRAINKNVDILILGNIQLEFENNRLKNCR